MTMSPPEDEEAAEPVAAVVADVPLAFVVAVEDAFFELLPQAAAVSAATVATARTHRRF